MIPLPEGERVNLIISNPAQLPLPQMERENSPFYAGPDGRSMIEAIIREAPNKLAPSGRLLITYNSMANLPKSLRLFEISRDAASRSCRASNRVSVVY